MTAVIDKTQNSQAVSDNTNIVVYSQMLLDSLAEKVNAKNPSPADDMVIRHVENELAKLIQFLR